MSKKRGQGMGSISKTGKTYQYSLYYKGKRHYGHAPSKKAAEIALSKLKNDIVEGFDITAAIITFIEWLKHWLSFYCTDIRPSTRSNYECYIEHISKHAIADISLSKLRSDDFQSLANYLHSDGRIDGTGGLSGKTIHSIFNMIGSAMSEAVHNMLIRMDVSRFAKLPKVRTQERPSLSVEEVDHLVQTAKQFDPSVYIGIFILANCGLRSGEMLALRQDSLQYKDGIAFLHVQYSLQRVKDFSAKAGESKTSLKLTSPKTENSVRKIPLSPDVAATIQEHIVNHNIKAKGSYGLFHENAFLVCDELGNMIDPSTFRKKFNEVVAAAGLPRTTTQHVLRHSRCSHLIQMGCSPKMVSLYMGHADAGFTMRTYTHYRLEDIFNELISHENKADSTDCEVSL